LPAFKIVESVSHTISTTSFAFSFFVCHDENV
jgi:hypothetical protein